jgi:hypothetical protein
MARVSGSAEEGSAHERITFQPRNEKVSHGVIDTLQSGPGSAGTIGLTVGAVERDVSALLEVVWSAEDRSG